MIGLQYFMQGKLEYSMQHLEESNSALRQAVLILGVTHPRDCQLMNDLYDLVHAVEVELGFRSHPQLTDVSSS